MTKTYEQKGLKSSRYLGMLTLSPDITIVLAAVAQLERDLIAERVRNGLANAKAKGVRIGRERKRNQALIESLLGAGLSYREIARISKCSHGSVHAAKKEYLAKKMIEEKSKQVELEKSLEFAAAESASGLADEIKIQTPQTSPSG